MSEDVHTLRSGGLTARILAHGAELCSLRDAQGIELIWQAGPAWPRHAPLLFPIVGRLKNDELRHQGRAYPMTQHGFARDLAFRWIERAEASCSLVLSDSAATRAHYPFAFRLAVTYCLQDANLNVALEVANPGEAMLPASIGAHPAFNWPLLPGAAKDGYRLMFSDDEPAPIRRLKGGLLRASPESSPIDGKTLALSERLFDDDAVILDQPVSRSVRYAAGKGPALEISWDGFRQLGIWSKPGGAPFLCIEPWRGFASPLDFDGEFSDKPGVMHIAPGASEVLKCRIGVR
ncbi:aldose 1-epimerase family protein [Bradyrhizobium sp.]|uniref:aldose 1-epimerase family protein n=1 Tax=Bradyrhizobium sp. TaxID=376 RepID=UPI003C50B5A6